MNESIARAVMLLLCSLALLLIGPASAAGDRVTGAPNQPVAHRAKAAPAQGTVLGAAVPRPEPGRLSSTGGPGCPADLDGSGSVGLNDLLTVIFNWGPCPGCPADLTGDGLVSTIDLVTLLVNWGACP